LVGGNNNIIMAKPKAPGQTVTIGTKRSSLDTSEKGRPEKRARVLLSEDSDGEASADGSGIGSADGSDAPGNNFVLSVNQEFARRFEYNKKREERQQRMYEVSTSY
jgi:hypothetical protein